MMFSKCNQDYLFYIAMQDSKEPRNSFSQSQMPEMANEHIWNHQPSDPRHNLGNGSFLFPSNNMAVWGLNSAAYHNIGPRPHLLQFPNLNSEGPSYITDFTRVGHDSFMHPPSTGDSVRLPPYPMQHRPYYSQVGIGNLGVTNNPQTDNERATYKRKFPAISDFNRGNINANYGAGSSSNPTSSEHFQTKPIVGSQFWPHDHASLGHNYRTNNTAFEDGSQRYVRSRHLEPLPNAGYSTTPQDLHSAANTSLGHNYRTNNTAFEDGSQRNVRSRHLEPLPNAGYSTTPQDLHSAANTSSSVLGVQWRLTPVSFDLHSVVNSSGAASSSFGHELGYSHASPYAHNGIVGIDGTCYPNFISGRTLAPLPAHNGRSTGGPVADHGGYGQRAAFRTNVAYPAMVAAPNVEDIRVPRLESAFPPMNLRPPSIVGRSYDRNTRPRPRNNRYSSEEGSHSRWASGSVVMTEQSDFYESRNLFDQHQEMRLDIDNMSYEELLALEERIGYVSTGLSKDAISLCLTELTYCSSNHIQDKQEEKCAICLEAYLESEQVARLKCRHNFHSSCITQWLLIKNVCPICKSPPLEDA